MDGCAADTRSLHDVSPEWPDTLLVLLIEKNNSLFVMGYELWGL